MCNTKYISNLFVPIETNPKRMKEVQVSMKRSDGEIFTSRISLLTEDEAERVRKVFNHFEELRTCICSRNSVCEKHSSLEKK